MTCFSSGAIGIPGHVGIGTGPAGSIALHVDNTNSYSETIMARATGTGGYGVYGYATGSYGRGTTGRGYYGIYGSSTSSSGYAGYFSGRVRITGTLTQGSDKKLKRNIKPIKSALSTVLQLEGKSYKYKADKYKDLNLSEGNQFGFIAQELETVLPELVSESEHQVFSTSENGEKNLDETITYKGVNYIAIIPILTEAIKEQNEIIENQQDLINNLQERMNLLEISKNTRKEISMTDTQVRDLGVLKQNAPNPFTDETTIQFTLPKGVTNASVLIHDMQGKQIKAYVLDSNNTSISINGGELEAGMYFYSLVIDNKINNTLKMVLTK